jgi:hypothetical protein
MVRLLCGFAMIALVACRATSAPPDPKLIEWGWGTPFLQDMPNFLTQIQTLPFDGAIIDIATPADGRGLSWTLFSAPPVPQSTWETLARDYSQIAWGRYTDNFLRMTVYPPADLNWGDDWTPIYQNAEGLARLAQELGFQGILLDTEQYGGVSLFSSAHRPSPFTVTEYNAFAFANGQALMEAFERGYPEVTVMYTFALSVEPTKTQFEGYGYDLLFPFIEGMMAAADDNTRLIDGFEDSYIYQQEAQYQAARARMDNPTRYNAAIPNRLEAGFGLWIDPVCGDGGLPPDGCGFSPAGFVETVGYALKYSESYVWVYSERINWYTNQRIPPEWWAAMGDL